MPTYSILTRSHLNLIAVGMPPPVVKVADYRLSLVPHRSAKYSTFFRPTDILLSQLWYIEGLVIFQPYRHQMQTIFTDVDIKEIANWTLVTIWSMLTLIFVQVIKIPIHSSNPIIFVLVFIIVQVVGEWEFPPILLVLGHYNNCLAVVVCTFVFVFVFIIVQVVRKGQMTSFISKLMDSKNLKKMWLFPYLYLCLYM